MNQKKDFPVTFEVIDSKIGLKGWLAIDSAINNSCCGGLLLSPYISRKGVIELARAMTLKFGFLSIPHGGAKAGIVCDESVWIFHIKKQILW